MASTGSQAWSKHFKGKGDLSTVMKKDSPLFDLSGKSAGRIAKGEKIIAKAAPKYDAKMPIEYKNKLYLTTFNNIQKPASKLVSGVKLKPQDFKALKTERPWKADLLAKILIDELEERTDLEAELKSYLIEITKYWAKMPEASKANVKKHYTKGMKGLNETQKDYGEMLGAIACVKFNLLKPPYNLTNTAKLLFPLRGNEPIVDYYIETGPKTRYNISAKTASSATNTLKPADALELLEKRGLTSKWKRKTVFRVFELIANNSVVQFPFEAINEVAGEKLITDDVVTEAKKFSKAQFGRKDYPIELRKIVPLTDMPTAMRDDPTLGQVWYYTEKYIIDTINTKHKKDLTDIFDAATSGIVIYVKYGISTAHPEGQFKVDIDDQQKKQTVKNIKLRSKNSTNRAADKVGLQP